MDVRDTPCVTGKRSFPDCSAAQAALPALRRNNRRDRRHLMAYRCRCGSWHLGHEGRRRLAVLRNDLADWPIGRGVHFPCPAALLTADAGRADHREGAMPRDADLRGRVGVDKPPDRVSDLDAPCAIFLWRSA